MASAESLISVKLAETCSWLAGLEMQAEKLRRENES
jgi:hypothetical protein